jgi:ABC-type antimicrobial peptide transport system permease subunit
MKLRRRLSSSLRPLFAHRTRTLLALSGVAVGVGAVIVSRAIGAGAEDEMVRTVEAIGTNLLIVKPLPVKRIVFRPSIVGFATTLRPDDCAAVATLPTVAAVAPAVETTTRIKAGSRIVKTTVRGTGPAYPSIRRFEIAAGRFYDATDDRARARVVVLGASVARQLFGEERPVGAGVRLRGIPFEVIGVLRAKGTTPDGADQDNQVLIPLGTAMRRVFNVTWLTSAYVAVRDRDLMDETGAAIDALLRERHRARALQPAEDFAVQNTARTRAIQQELTASLSRYAAGLGAIALLVGGVGILALMFLSIRERTSEIGLRMAVGAQPRDILLQFLIEASVLALAGWAAGAVLGGGVTAIVALTTSWAVGLPLDGLAMSLALVFLLGLGFGAWPARKAARIPPIEALLLK